MTVVRRSVGTGASWEARYGYCRAVAVGDSAWVAGTTASSTGADAAPYAADQARVAFEIALGALDDLGFAVTDVVRTRMYLTDITDADQVGRVHAEVFGSTQPVATMVAVSALVDPALVVEVELEARRAPAL